MSEESTQQQEAGKSPKRRIVTAEERKATLRARVFEVLPEADTAKTTSSGTAASDAAEVESPAPLRSAPILPPPLEAEGEGAAAATVQADPEEPEAPEKPEAQSVEAGESGESKSSAEPVRSASRKRATRKTEANVAAKKKQRVKTIEGFDTDVLTDIAQQHEWVNVSIQRLGASGKWVYLRGLHKVRARPATLPEILPALQQYAGGGSYIVTLSSVDNAIEVLAHFRVTTSGAPKPEPDNYTIRWVEDQERFVIVPQDETAFYTHEIGIGAEASRRAEPRFEGLGGARPGFAASPFGATMRGARLGGRLEEEDNMHRTPFLEPKRDPLTGRLLPPPSDLVPEIHRRLPLEAQWEIAQRNYQAQHGIPSDQMAMYFNRQLEEKLRTIQAENAALRERMEAVQREREQELERLREERARLEREAERQRYEAQMAELRAELKALSEGKKSGGLDPETKKLLLGALSSVGPAVLKVLSESSSASKQQMLELMKTTLEAKKGGAETLAQLAGTVLPAVVPIVQKVIESKSPEMLAQVNLANTEAAMASLKLAFDLIQQEKASQGEVKWWMPIVDQILQTLDMAVTAKAMQGGNVALPPGHPLGGQLASDGTQDGEAAQSEAQTAQAAQGGQDAGQAQTQAEAQAQAIAVKVAMAQVPSGVWEHLQQNVEVGKAVTKLWQSTPPTLGFMTPEWLVLLYDLAAKTYSADEMADRLIAHLAHLEELGTLPKPLEDVYAHPEQVRFVLSALGEQIPGADKVYLEAVAKRVMHALAAPENGAGVVTPAPEATDASGERPADEPQPDA